MRISDWSSDVCSSDLTVRGTDRSVQDGGSASRLAAASGSPATHAAWPPRQARNPCLDPVGRSWLPDLLRAGPAAQGPIGRASCRERVCQYVYISVVAVSLKKIST